MNKIDEITQIIGHEFRSFGGGRGSRFNPMAEALKDKEFQFAAGVDIKSVVEAVLIIANWNDLLKACERDALLADIAISATPTSDLRNKLTDINILRLDAITKAQVKSIP